MKKNQARQAHIVAQKMRHAAQKIPLLLFTSQDEADHAQAAQITANLLEGAARSAARLAQELGTLGARKSAAKLQQQHKEIAAALLAIPHQQRHAQALKLQDDLNKGAARCHALGFRIAQLRKDRT
jgi:hypothetical protein